MLDATAHSDLMKQNSKSFCKVRFINTWPKCDVVTSNLANLQRLYMQGKVLAYHRHVRRDLNIFNGKNV